MPLIHTKAAHAKKKKRREMAAESRRINRGTKGRSAKR